MAVKAGRLTRRLQMYQIMRINERQHPKTVSSRIVSNRKAWGRFERGLEEEAGMTSRQRLGLLRSFIRQKVPIVLIGPSLHIHVNGTRKLLRLLKLRD